MSGTTDRSLDPDGARGGLETEAGEAPLPGAAWYVAHAEGDGLEYRFPSGALAGATCLSADMLLDGRHLAAFRLTLREGDAGPAFHLDYGALTQCQARIRIPLEVVNQNRWRYNREGAWLKPLCGGQRVDLARVDRMTVTVLRKSDRPVRWCMTPFTASIEPPPRIESPVLPAGPLLDELGQTATYDWPGKSRSAAEVTARLRDQVGAAPDARWPDGFSRWGGWITRRVEATGFFRTHHDGRRWWLVDPDGCLFWSAGLDCVRVDTEAVVAGLDLALQWRPEPAGPYAAACGTSHDGEPTVNYLAASFIRACGSDDWYARWAETTFSAMKRWGFNTVGNWSDWQVASAASMPYVRPLHERGERAPLVFRDFPDVFHPGFAEDAAAFAEPLRETAGDPAMIGYFMGNEPTWGFAQETPAAGMLLTAPPCPARTALAAFLLERHGSDSALSAAWNLPISLAAVEDASWRGALTDAARADLADFSAIMVERLLGGLADACRRVDPHHLNLGARYYTVPPPWALAGMKQFDVFSMNCYDTRVNAESVARIVELLDRPVMIGEWHFGALDVGLPGSGIGHVRDQAARGRAFRVYTEDAAAQPGCVGVHYFTLYDESALGRFDGENWNIGFMDVCNRPYAPLAEAARASHERVYAVASGEAQPYDDAPEYLPKLFV